MSRLDPARAAEIFRDGYAAAAAGQNSRTNPYQLGDPENEPWLRGWVRGRDVHGLTPKEPAPDSAT